MLPATDTPTIDAEGLQNISDKGTPPPSRLRDYKSAAEIVKQLILEDEPDRMDRVNEQALLDGQGPFIQHELDKSGQSWRQNNDWGGASSKSEQAQAPYGELFNGFTVELDSKIEGQARFEISSKFAESWKVLHSRIWRDHAFQNLNLTRIAVNFGVSIANHETSRDWRWRAGGLGEHYFPRPMQAFEDATNIHVVVREYREDELYKWYNNPKAEGVGYNKEAIKKAMLACNSSSNNSSDYWNNLTNNIYGTTYSRRAGVRLFTMRTVEMTDDGEVIREVMGQSDGSGDDFIFNSKKPGWKESMSDCFTLFASGIGNGDLHSVKGIARKLFNTSQTENQFINQMFDFARVYMSPMFESDDNNAAQKLSAMKIGLFNLIPRGLKLIPTTAVAPNYATSILPLLNFSSQLGQQASGIFTPQQSPASVEQTREEVLHRTMQNAVITSAAMVLHENALERLYNSELRRLQRRDWSPKDPGYRERKLWIEDLAERGVEEEAIYLVRYIKPNRQVGGGSAAVGQMLLEKAAGLRSYLDPIGQKMLDEMVMTRLIGSDNTKILMPSLGIQRTSEQMRFAMDENAFFLLGVAKPVLPDDDHFQHAQIHDLALPDAEVQFARGELQPPQMLAFLNRFIPHQKGHLQALASNTAQAKAIGQFNANLNKAVQTQEHLINSAQAEQNRLAQQAQAQAEKQQQSPGGGGPSGVADAEQKLQVRAAEAQQDLAVKSTAAQLELQQKQADHTQDLQHRAERHEQEQAFRDQNSAAELLDQPPSARPTIPPTAPVPRVAK